MCDGCEFRSIEMCCNNTRRQWVIWRYGLHILLRSHRHIVFHIQSSIYHHRLNVKQVLFCIITSMILTIVIYISRIHMTTRVIFQSTLTLINGTTIIIVFLCGVSILTRTTRTPAFWGYPPSPLDYPYYWPVRFEPQVHTIDQFISDPKSKEGESRKK